MPTPPSRTQAELSALSTGERDLATALLRAAEAEADPARRAVLFDGALAATDRAELLAGLARQGGGLGAVVAQSPGDDPDGDVDLVAFVADRELALARCSPATLALAPSLSTGSALLDRIAGPDAAAARKAARRRRGWARLRGFSERIGEVVTGLLLGVVFLLGGLFLSGKARRTLGRGRNS